VVEVPPVTELLFATARGEAGLFVYASVGSEWSSNIFYFSSDPKTRKSSNDFDAYWKFHEQQKYERHHASHYADHRVPETVPSAVSSSRPTRRRTLKIVTKEEES
jgi:hypothetical protein